MSKYTGPKFKIINKLGILPALTKKNIKNNLKTKDYINQKKTLILDNYKINLIEKQKIKYNFNINEKQLINYYKKAKNKIESKEILFLIFLESRLDYIIYRLGFALTILEARQLINHCHILVNNKILNISSYKCKINDIITFNPKSTKSIINIIKNNIEKKNLEEKNIIFNLEKKKLINYYYPLILPTYLELNLNNFLGKIISDIKINNNNSLLYLINELKIIEYYYKF